MGKPRCNKNSSSRRLGTVTHRNLSSTTIGFISNQWKHGYQLPTFCNPVVNSGTGFRVSITRSCYKSLMTATDS